MPGALFQLLERVTSTYESAGDFIFNCQMGRGRTTTGMVTACLIATAMNLNRDECLSRLEPDSIIDDYDAIDGPSEEEAYLQGAHLSNQTPPLCVNNLFRGVQDHSSARWCPLAWKDCEEVDGRCRRPYARRPESAQSYI